MSKMTETKTKLPKKCARCGRDFCMSRLPLFQELSTPMQLSLAANAREFRKEKNSILFYEKDPIHSVYIIREGQIKLCRIDEEGHEYILDVLTEGDSIWESLFLQNASYPYTAVCLTDAVLCEVSKTAFTSVIVKEPDAAVYLISVLSQRLQDAKEHAMLLSIHDADVRLAGFLLDREKRWPGVEIRMRLEDIASSVSLRPETVSRVLRKFEKEGIIRRDGHGKFCIEDFAALRRIFHGETKQGGK